MIAKRIAVKFFAAPKPEAKVELAPFVPMFHRFIQKTSLDGLLLDVANYIHVPNGPGVVLIGHDVDYGIDSTGGETGLLTVRKRIGEQSLADALRDTLHKALSAVREIEADGTGKIAFATNRARIEVIDRIAAGNDAAGFEAVKKEIASVLASLYGDAKLELAHEAGDARRALALDVTAAGATDVATLLGRLGAPKKQATRAAEGDAMPGNVRGPVVPGQSDWDISVEQLEHLRKTGADLVLVDVREQHEFDICELGGELIPLGSLGERLSELDPRAHVVVHCHLGGRSAHATRLLRANGFDNAWNLQGGIRAWIERIDPSLQDY